MSGQPPPPRGPPPGIAAAVSATGRTPPAPAARRPTPTPPSRAPPAAPAAAPPSAAASSSNARSVAPSSSSAAASSSSSVVRDVPLSALQAPKEGDWLASVPAVGDGKVIRPSRFIDAAKKGQNELLAEFWNDPEKAIEINKIDPIYMTALHWAARGGHLSTVKLLLSWGADPNFRDKTGETPLHKAAFGNYAACCSTLLDAGAHRDIQNHQHKIAMDLTEDRNTRFSLALVGLVEEEDQPFEQDDDDSD